jgi:hypothetical protein
MPIDEAINIALRSTLPHTDDKNRSIISNLLIDKVVQTPIEDIGEELFKETYNDILGSPYLKEFMALRNAGRSLTNLKGIKSNSAKIFNPNIAPDEDDVPEIRALQRVAFENLMLGLGTYTDSTDITSDEATLAIVNAKGQRFGAPVSGEGAFATIQEISGVPNLGAAFASKDLSPDEIVKLRESKQCQSLREWLAKQDSSCDSAEIVQKYIETIGRPSLIESIPAKILRFGATTVIGVFNPVAGIMVSLADSFLLSKWSNKQSPRLFMKEAKILMQKKRKDAEIQMPIMRGRDRNKPCYCGSGKKYKNCHGN